MANVSKFSGYAVRDALLPGEVVSKLSGYVVFDSYVPKVTVSKISAYVVTASAAASTARPQVAVIT